MDDTLAIGNYLLQSNVGSSWCSRFSVLDNFFDHSTVSWNNRDLYPLRKSFMTMRGNAFVDPPGGYLSHIGPGFSRTAYPEGFSNCLVDYNRVRVKKGGVLINDGGSARQVKRIEDIRKIYGWEFHGEVKPYDPKDNDLTPEAMGGSTVTYRIPWGKRTHEARPMLSDAGVECCFPAAPEQIGTGEIVPAFFWRIADGDGKSEPLMDDNAVVRPLLSPSAHGDGRLRRCAQTAGCTWYLDAEKKTPPALLDKNVALRLNFDTPGGSVEMNQRRQPLPGPGRQDRREDSAPGRGILESAAWQLPGAKITVSLRIRGKDIVSTEKGSPTVWLEFTNETGQHRQRAFVVGKDDQGKIHHGELNKGSYGWKEIKETITAPKDAIRMALFSACCHARAS